MAEFGGELHLFHRDFGGEVRHRCSVDGRVWSAGGSVGLAGEAPVVVAFGARLFVLFRGLGDAGRIEVCSTDGQVWERARRIGRGESVRTSTRPAVVGFRGRLHVFFRGESAAGTVFSVSTVNGRQWQGPANLTEATRGARAAGPPFPVVFDGRLAVLVRDPASSRIAVFESGDGVNWSAGRVLVGSESEGSPVAVVHDSQLFVFFQGLGGLVGVVSRSPGGGWGEAAVIPRAVHWPPVPVALGERLVLLARDYLDPRSLGAIGSGCGGDWVAQPTALDDVASTPSAVVRGEHATVAFRDTGGAVSSVTLLAAENRIPRQAQGAGPRRPGPRPVSGSPGWEAVGEIGR